MSAPISTCRGSSTADHPVEQRRRRRSLSRPARKLSAQLDGELGAAQAAAGQGPDPARLPDRQGDQQMTPERQGRPRRRRAGRKPRRRRTKDIPGDWARPRPRHRRSRRSRRRSNASSPSCRPSAPRATMDAGMWARPHGDEYYRWALRASTTTTHDARRDPPDGPRPARRAARPDGPDPEEPRLHPGHGRRADDRRWPRTRATSSPRATGPRRDHGLHPGAAARSSAPSCRAPSAPWSAAISK